MFAEGKCILNLERLWSKPLEIARELEIYTKTRYIGS